MTFSRSLYASFFRNEKDTRYKGIKQLSWQEVVELHRTHDIRAKKSGPMYGGYALKGPRSDENAMFRSVIQLDIDTEGVKDEKTGRIIEVTKPALALAELAPHIADFEWFAVSSHWHEPRRGVIKYRIVILPDRDVKRDEYIAILEALDERLQRTLDRGAWQWSQAFYLPSCPDENKDDKFFVHNEGEPLPVDQFAQRGGQILAERGKASTPKNHANRITGPAADEPETADSIARIKSALDAIDPDIGRSTWRNICWSVMATGWQCAEEVAREWSEKGDKYSAEEFDKVIGSFKRGGGIGVGTLIHHAQENGWSDPLHHDRPAEITRPIKVDWKDFEKSGKPARTLRNTKHALEQLGLSFSHDMFRNRKVIGCSGNMTCKTIKEN